MENELGADMEQCPPSALALGLDHEDFLAALAPKPVIILAKEKDYFDARGNEAAYQRLKRLYRLLGAEDNIALLRRADLPRLLAGEPRGDVPVVQSLHGRSLADLPGAARDYVAFVEEQLGVEVSLIGTGAERARVLSARDVEAVDAS